MIDTSYNIKEYEVDHSWIKDLSTEDYLEYRRKWDLASQKQQLFDFPLFLEVESSYACNYKCPKCPKQLVNPEKKSGFLSNELFDKLFDEVREYRMPAINFSHGGEPLMNKNIATLIAKARDAHILDRMFHTNGSLLKKDLAKELIESGLTKINISLDAATAETYKKVRVGGVFENVIANVNNFLEAKREFGKSFPRVRVSFVVSEENKHEQQKFFDMWKLKVNMIAFQQCYDFSKMTKGTDDQNCDKIEKRNYFCSQLWQLLTITCEGHIIICERDYNNEFILGNLKTHTIYECWHSKEMSRFRELHKNNKWNEIPMCRKCVTSVK